MEPLLHETQPPARFTEASLIKKLEEEGIGRPSTYASVITTIQSREYVVSKSGALLPSYTGIAVTHLLDQGVERILLLTGPADNFDSIQRLNGAKQAFEDTGKDFTKATVIESHFTYEGGIQHMTEYLDSGKPLPEAIFAFNDRMALGAIEALKAKGKTVPEDLIVVGFDDTEIALYAGLTTVHVPMQDIGYEAANLAIRRIGQKKFNPSTITVNTSLSARKSTEK